MQWEFHHHDGDEPYSPGAPPESRLLNIILLLALFLIKTSCGTKPALFYNMVERSCPEQGPNNHVILYLVFNFEHIFWIHIDTIFVVHDLQQMSNCYECQFPSSECDVVTAWCTMFTRCNSSPLLPPCKALFDTTTT